MFFVVAANAINTANGKAFCLSQNGNGGDGDWRKDKAQGETFQSKSFKGGKITFRKYTYENIQLPQQNPTSSHEQKF